MPVSVERSCRREEAISPGGTTAPGAFRRRFFTALRGGARIHIVRGIAWSFLGSVVAQGASLLTSIVLAHILGRNDYGAFAMIQSTTVTLTYLASLGLGLTATKYVSEYRASRPERLGRILGLSSLVVFVAALVFTALLVFAPALAPGGRRSVALAAGARLSAPYVFFMTIIGHHIGILAGFESFRSLAVLGGAQGVAGLALSCACASRWGIAGGVAGQSGAAAIAWALYHYTVKRTCRAEAIAVCYRGAWRERSVLFRVSLPAGACGSLISLATWGGSVILASVSGYAELAIFSAATAMRSLVIFLPALLFRVASPRLNHILASGDTMRYRRAFRNVVSVNTLLAVLQAVALLLIGPRLLRVFGKDFTAPKWLIFLVLASGVIEIVATNLYLDLFTAGRLWRNLKVVGIWSVCLLCAARLAVPRFGASGLAFSYLVAWSVSAALYAVAARRQIRLAEPAPV